MDFSLEVQSEAIVDIQDAFEWYEAQKEGLGFEFIEELENGFQNICKHPQYYLSINSSFRRLRIKRFPYLIIYEIVKESVIVISVMHGSKKSKL